MDPARRMVLLKLIIQPALRHDKRKFDNGPDLAPI